MCVCVHVDSEIVHFKNKSRSFGKVGQSFNVFFFFPAVFPFKENVMLIILWFLISVLRPESESFLSLRKAF